MATPAIRAVRKQWPRAEIIAVGRPYVFNVLENSPRIDQWLAFDNRGSRAQQLLAVAGRLRDLGIDLALIFPNSFRAALAAWLGRCRRRVGYARYGRSWLLTDRLQPVRDSRGGIMPSPILPAYNALAQRAGCLAPSLKMELFTSRADEAGADDIWRKFRLDDHREVVCLNPGAAFGAAKLWPAESFAKLSRQLAECRDCGILVLCGPAERDLARRIVTLTNHPAVHSLADKEVSIGLSKACIKRCDLLVSTDSGPRHFAAALDRPVVALFGPTHIAWTDTFFPREIQLQKKVPCGPCQQRVCHLDHRCMTQLSPDEVFAAAERLLPHRAKEVRHAG